MPNIIPDLFALPAEQILEAIGEFDELGEKGFLAMYPPYHGAKKHFGFWGDVRFPPRAVLAAAYFKVHSRIPDPEEGPRKLSGDQLKEIFGKYGIEVVREKVPSLKLAHRDSVLEAIHEFDVKGREKFLDDHGFSPAKKLFILFDNDVYDAKAVFNVAREIEHGNKATESIARGNAGVGAPLRRLDFTVIDQLPPDMQAPIVLVQNEGMASNIEYNYDNVIGEKCSYPNSYINMVRTGRKFIYYRGKRTASGGARTPEYFGCGVIGEIEPDPTTVGVVEKKDRRWTCKIAEYNSFDNPVPFKIDGKPYEDIHQNQWGVGVRVLADGVYEKILDHAGENSVASVPKKVAKPILPKIDEVIAEPASVGLMRPTKPSGKSGKSGGSGGPTRRSKFSKEIGDRGEEIILEHLRQILPEKEKATLKWTAQEGEKPGWDIEYKSGGRDIGVEVKATGGAGFTNVELTANEWRAAEEKRGDYRLALVSLAKSLKPQIEFIEDPWGQVQAGDFGVEPLSWRFVKTAEM